MNLVRVGGERMDKYDNQNTMYTWEILKELIKPTISQFKESFGKYTNEHKA